MTYGSLTGSKWIPMVKVIKYLLTTPLKTKSREKVSRTFEMYHSFSQAKAAITERLVRTLKDQLFKYFSLKGSHKCSTENCENIQQSATW